MSATNGKPASDINHRSELRAQRTHNRLLAEQIRGRKLESAHKRSEQRAIRESMLFDWVDPYMDMLGQGRSAGDLELAGPSSYWNKSRGQNYPIFQNEQQLNLLRAPAYVLEATNDYAQAILEGVSAFLVGTGFTHRCAKKKNARPDTPDELAVACQAVIDEFHERTEWFGGEQPAVEEECLVRSMTAGEFLILHFCDHSTGLTDIRIGESERLTQPPGSDPREYSFGILTPFDDVSRHLKYYYFFGDNPADGDEFGRESVTHFRRNVKRSIKRGLTDFCWDTLDGLYLASKLRTNLADAAAQQASIVGVRQHAAGTKEEIEAWASGDADTTQTNIASGTTENVKRHKRGGWEDMPEGMTYVAGPISSAAPQHLNILQACLRGCCRRWTPPDWLISGDASNNTFSNAEISQGPFGRKILQRQPNYAQAFRRTDILVLKHWCMTHGGIFAAGKLWPWEEIQRRIDVLVEGHDPFPRDPEALARTAAIEMSLQLDSPQQYMQRQGRDPDQVAADNESWEAENGTAGDQLPLPGDAGAGTTGGGQSGR